MTDFDAEKFAPGNRVTEGRIGTLWAEVNGGIGFIALFSRKPESYTDKASGIEMRKLKDIDYIGIGPVNALALLKFLKRWEPEIVKLIAEDAFEAAGRR